MKLIFAAIFIAAVALQVWTRLALRTRQRIVSRATRMINQAANAVRDAIFRRRMAYRRAFLDDRGELNADGRIIIAHLAKLCRATASKGIVAQGPFGPAVDTNATMLAVGRNEVFQVMMKELHLDMAQVFAAVRQEEDALAA